MKAKVSDKKLMNLIRQLRVTCDRSLVHLILCTIEKMVPSSKGAAYFINSYGPDGSVATPSEWQRSFLKGLPTSSVVIERVHCQVKKVTLFAFQLKQ